ncbi:hypothetical protein MCOR07_002916 [Pyricularia oryzae]|uniref:Mitotic checkpoint protein BUB3 n=5 Tax=Pyricularia TaxID=48558 RepID=A0ABQ8NSB7_PYRGI|nr:mitotic checkpoint protein BUB3 [Pyricularia oryzae 70-15]ELQ43489.1 mitotic checkpoint protein BUB3 [Pyricularia oryzae Y34]KAI6300857.1 hypothetical protein MCOR33_003484 [Pyricularia grisea]KAI6337196.1 hypothetical protein MCOR30_003489 [Pyricularia oryzae]EHA52171.1 mitotic checkpoint protein BUB3 [Pyricularia oryzae 70-15]KAI6376773.1 hypothetical protein MCOR31_001522 [Pyricularia oryzae]
MFEAEPAPGDCPTAMKFAPGSRKLLVSSMDGNIYMYELQGEGEDASAPLVRQISIGCPVLDVTFGSDDKEGFCTGADSAIKRVDLESGDVTVVGKHEKPARCIIYSPEYSILASGSWDCTLQIWNAKDLSKDPIIVQLPVKVHAMAASKTKLVVGMHNRMVQIFDLPAIAQLLESGASGSESGLKPWQQRESSLKFMTRAIACMPNDAGYATSSTEGRVAVEFFEDSAEVQARKYAFKCHRGPDPKDPDTELIYPVDSLAFHPEYLTFVSGGGDGQVALWDSEAKRRMKIYPMNGGLAARTLAFSADGRFLAIGTCPGFEDTMENYSGKGQSHVLIRELSEKEVKPKPKKSK